MNIELRQLSVDDDLDVYDMLQEVPKDENGFTNGCNGRDFEGYKKWLQKSNNTISKVNLSLQMRRVMLGGFLKTRF